MVTSSVGAAARIISEYGVGQVLPIGVLDGAGQGCKLDISALNRNDATQSFKAFDVSQFDIESVVAKYTSVYGFLLRQAAR